MRLLNGQPAEMLPLSDRAIQFGDGVFRTIRLQAGKLLFWARHYRKLCADCAAIGIAAPEERVLLDEIGRLMIAASMPDAAVKVMVTRGESARGYVIPSGIRPNRIVQVTPLPEYAETLYREGANVRLCRMRAGWQPALAGIKHLNRLENVLARQEWSDPGILEGLLLDRDGNLVEGVMSNVMLWRNGRLQTPVLDGAGVAGIMRDVVQDAARELGWPVMEIRISLSDLFAAERVWLCNSLMGLLPVRRLEAHCWSVDADPALTAKLMQLARKEAICVSCAD